jgi:signal transduction histidine kinase
LTWGKEARADDTSPSVSTLDEPAPPQAESVAASRDFWRRRALELGEKVKWLENARSHETSSEREIELAFAAASGLEAGDRFAGLGSLMAEAGGFSAWVVAALKNGKLELTAASLGTALLPALDAGSALRDCFDRQASTLRARHSVSAQIYHEDRLFTQFHAYLCLPFTSGAVALAARVDIDSGARAHAERLAARLDPLVTIWTLEAQMARQRELIRTLGLRMAGAIDAERARLARDLHDDQAQLLAAARLALESNKDEARSIFRQLEAELRRRVRELRPVLSDLTLEEALHAEAERLARAGIDVRTLRLDSHGLPRPIQQVCYQVAREAFANVLRHSGADAIEVTLERQNRLVRLRIAGNGRGISPEQRRGTGLKGLKERIEILGGRLLIASRRGATELVAEIPEAT